MSGKRAEKANPSPEGVDVVTVIAVAAVAYALATVLHEGVGHGGACLLAGGRPLVVSTVHFEGTVDSRFVAAGGTISNLLFGALFWLALRASRRGAAALRYFLWMEMTVNLLQGGGYFLYSGIANIGDWAEVVRGLAPAPAWRIGLIAVGAVSYWSFVKLALHELRPFLGGDRREAVPLAVRLTLTPYLAGGALECVAGAFNPVGMVLVAISAAAASFGGTSGLAWMASLLRRWPADAAAPPQLRIGRSRAWIALGLVTAAAFIVLLGPGLRFQSVAR
jgi:hypothetical protein